MARFSDAEIQDTVNITLLLVMGSNMDDMPDKRTCAQKTPCFSLMSRYLLIYNVSMTAGWIMILTRLLAALVHGDGVYDQVHLPLQLFQTGAVLEVLHAMTGIVRTSALTTALQVGSRLMLVWGVTEPVVRVRDRLSFTTMVLAWSLTEIPRYFYFSVSSATAYVPYWVTFMRYSTFLPLYPMGATSEWVTLYLALDDIRTNRLFSISLPNRFNFAFDYYSYCVIILALYVPGLPYMYSHMLRQRRKYVIDPSRTAQPKLLKSQ